MIFLRTLNLSSANDFNLNQLKMLSCSKQLGAAWVSGISYQEAIGLSFTMRDFVGVFLGKTLQEIRECVTCRSHVTQMILWHKQPMNQPVLTLILHRPTH